MPVGRRDQREVRRSASRPAASRRRSRGPATKSARLAAGRGTPSQVCRFAPSRSVSTATTRQAEARELGREVRRQERLADAALAAAEGDDVGAAGATRRRLGDGGRTQRPGTSARYSRSSTFQYEASTTFRNGRHSSWRAPVSIRCASGVQRGRLGRRISTMPACTGVRPALVAIAVDAARDDVLPRGAPAERARHDVVEVQLGARGPLAAVLTLEAVARHDVDAAEAHVAARQPVEADQHDHARNADRAPRACRRSRRRAPRRAGSTPRSRRSGTPRSPRARCPGRAARRRAAPRSRGPGGRSG